MRNHYFVVCCASQVRRHRQYFDRIMAGKCECLYEALRIDPMMAYRITPWMIEQRFKWRLSKVVAGSTSMDPRATLAIALLTQAKQVIGDMYLEVQYWRYGQGLCEAEHSCHMSKLALDFIKELLETKRT